MGFSEKRPIETGIISHENLAIAGLVSREEVPLKRIIKINSLQTLFQYNIIGPPRSLGITPFDGGSAISLHFGRKISSNLCELPHLPSDLGQK
jgi:hypothetical protein